MAYTTRIKQRFDTLENWNKNLITLLDGELAIVKCKNAIRFKVGNGLSSFTELPYADEKEVRTRSIAQGYMSNAIPTGLAAGSYVSADAIYSQAMGFNSKTNSADSYSFVWNGDKHEYPDAAYESHGEGTFSINALSGLSGIYFGNDNVAEILNRYYKKSETSSSNEISIAIKNIDVSKQLSGYVKLSSEVEQSISSNIQVNGWLRVGNLSVNGEGSSGKAEWGYITGDIEQQQDLLGVNYPLDNPAQSSEVVSEITYKRFDIKDHTIATIALSDSTPVRVHFPPKPSANFCRDFIVKIKVTSVTMPQVYFVKADNDSDIGFEYADEDWTTLEAGVNYFTFTETERS